MRIGPGGRDLAGGTDAKPLSRKRFFAPRHNKAKYNNLMDDHAC